MAPVRLHYGGLGVLVLAVVSGLCCVGFSAAYHTPIRGWNPADTPWGAPNETLLYQVAQAMTDQKLLEVGYNYITIDGPWWGDDESAPTLDGYGRYWPDQKKYPSAADGNGLRTLADKLKGLGFNLGVWIVRGVPTHAVNNKLPVFGTNCTADEIVDHSADCTWDSFNYGVNMSHPCGQAYYDSIAALYADWHLSLVKADCYYGEPEYKPEIAGFATAMAKHPEVGLSWSPGNLATVDEANWLVNNSYGGIMYRITGDMWDFWWHVLRAFDAASAHSALLSTEGPSFPDLDILAAGYGFESDTVPIHWANLTWDEQVTQMNLWAITRSPLFIGCELPTNNQTLTLFTNTEVLALQNSSHNNKEHYHSGDGLVIWTAEPGPPPAGPHPPRDDGILDLYVGVFNIANDTRPPTPSPRSPAVSGGIHGGVAGIHVTLAFSELDLSTDPGVTYTVWDMWLHQKLGSHNHRDGINVFLPYHASKLLRITSSTASLEK